MNPKPNNIKLVRSKSTLEIEWDNGQREQYPLAGLRAACPCAECRQKNEQSSDIVSKKLLEVSLQPGISAQIYKIEKVGNYALRMIWEDGHAYGIYSWDYLYALSFDHPEKE
jgi:DUF971 family protein